ncbi:ribose 5-phosphate isomerase B [Candidatus Woesearchaeota archaeon]|nr:ribose 5-phosphate isomerase B [Candidatus Woesearchaeota archaeon]
MKVIIGSDHGGFRLKEKVKAYLDRRGVSYEDLMPEHKEGDDYPDIAAKVARKVAGKKGLKGILVCGSGTGMVIAANKVKGIRAVAAYDAYTARMSRTDNDSNLLCLRGRTFPMSRSLSITDTWLKTPFSGKDRHKRRLAKISRMER